MAKKNKSVPQYGTVTRKGILYYRTRIQDADGKQVSLYATTCEELYEKQLAAKKQVEEILFRRKHPTVAEYCEKWLLMQSAKVSSATMKGYTSDMRNYIIKPLVSAYTLILAIIIIFKALQKDKIRQRIKRIFPLAMTGGFLDSIGGGGWGPIVSSTLIARGRNPRYTIGSVNLAEFFIALSSSLTFVTIIGLTHWTIIAGLIIGGVIAAPIAAYIANKIPTKGIMILVGIVVIILSLKRLLF